RYPKRRHEDKEHTGEKSGEPAKECVVGFIAGICEVVVMPAAGVGGGGRHGGRRSRGGAIRQSLRGGISLKAPLAERHRVVDVHVAAGQLVVVADPPAWLLQGNNDHPDLAAISRALIPFRAVGTVIAGSEDTGSRSAREVDLVLGGRMA